MKKIFKQLKKIKFIQVLVVILLLIIVYLYIRNNYSFLNNKYSQESTSITASIESGCTRSTRLENKPRYDRALSLIKERLDNSNNKNPSEEWKWKSFPANLTNCIVVTEKSLDKETQGYYIFNSEDTKPNYFPITVNSNYEYSDDINTALLLVHEMTHVQQYIDSLNGKTEPSCVDGEVSAFMAMYRFHEVLTSEEWMSLRFRMEQDDYPNLAAPLKTLRSMNQFENESGCNVPYNKKCVDNYMQNELKKIISTDDNYKKLCDIK